MNKIVKAHKKGELTEEQEKSDTFRTHYGDLQFWHAMTDGTDTAQGLKKKIMDRIRSLLKESIMDKNGKRRKCPLGLPLGKALHTIQDAFSPSHVERNRAFQITRYQDYSKQDSHKHGDTKGLGDQKLGREYTAATNATKVILNMVYFEDKTVEEIVRHIDKFYFNHAGGAAAGGSAKEYLPTPKKPAKPFVPPMLPIGL